MEIRRAYEKDIPKLIELLQQVLEIHADIRPDIFIKGTTKYTSDELLKMIKDDINPIYVAVDDGDVCIGYAFCQLKEQPFSNNMVQFKSLFIDDLCVDQEARGQHIGESLFEYVKSELKDLFAMADVVVSRAGANSICEILALKKPNLLIPLSASSSRGDQILNAKSFEKLIEEI